MSPPNFRQPPRLQGCRCPACGSNELQDLGSSWPDEEIVEGAIACQACGERYDAIWGTPFLGHYEGADALGLIEIAANARADNSFADVAVIQRIERLLKAYHAAVDKDAFVANCPDSFVREPWFTNRYHEWLELTVLLRGIRLKGKKILDVGAGSGYDAWRLASEGGLVTALEYNPMLVRRGRSVVPSARWFGGFSHVIPFADQSFDIVCCNAALHHMRDIPAAIREMLRVLRPGGWLLTTGDPFRASECADDLEFTVFNRHPDVLLGVNESIPRFAALSQALVEHCGALETRFITSTLYGAVSEEHQVLPDPPDFIDRMQILVSNAFRKLGHPLVPLPASGVPVPDWLRQWSFSAVDDLGKISGSIAIRTRMLHPPAIPCACQGSTALRAGEYARTLNAYEEAVTRTAGIVPDEWLNRDFPGTDQTKVELLNGWQSPVEGETWRRAYRRSRWFLKRPEGGDTLSFLVRPFRQDDPKPTFHVLINGTPTVERIIGPEARTRQEPSGWALIEVPLNAITPDHRFVCELRLEPSIGDGDAFDNHCFDVAERHFLMKRG